MNASEFVSLLEALGFHPHRNGQGWKAHCPAHPDETPSLSLAEGADGRVLVRCHAGCTAEAVCRAVGLAPPDLFATRLDLWRPLARPTPLADTPEKAAKRARWPRFAVPTADELRQLAALRSLSFDGLALAARRGLLLSAHWQGAPCWIVTDSTRHVAQARRYDGQPLRTKDGGATKALTMPGSAVAYPVGLPDAAPFPCGLFCEGGGDLLAAHHFITVEGREWDCAAVALLGASLTIHPDALPAFEGKAVTLAAQADPPGLEAAARWLAQLRPHAARVAVLSFSGLRRVDGELVKDLGDLTQIDADDFEAHRFLWNLCPAAP